MRHYYGLVLVGALLAVLMAASLFIGAHSIPAQRVWPALSGVCRSPDCIIIMDSRLPRMLAGVLSGLALGLSGALMQSLTRNPLADPGILGVNAGAGFAVVVGITYFKAVSINSFLWFAFAGAFAAALLVALIGAVGGGRLNPIRLTLAGVALGAVLDGAASGISLLNPLVYDQLRFWQAGSLDIRSMAAVKAVCWPIALGAALTLCLSRALNSLSMGSEMATAVGSRVGLTQLGGLLAITLLCGAATALVGPIAFVGLMMPHIARRIAGPDHRRLLPWTLLLTPVLLLGSDVVGRVIVPGELRVSVITALLGAPVLIALVRRHRLISRL